MICYACGLDGSEYDSARGASFCTGCGNVLEENAIVSEITFGESSSGAAVVHGSYINAGSTGASRMGPRGLRSGAESREQTLANGKRRILGIANGLNLPDRVSDSAYRIFVLALANRFLQGRRSEYVTASVLYVACRMEKTSHMLIDFSDFLHINVFVLGATYLKLVKELNLYGQIPQIDPSLFISRFAQLLEFGEETQGVAHDAIRLVQRFSRDWMDTGRRPAGICGAALLLAARMNNFRRSIDEIVQVVKIADVTLRKRLEEFKATPSGNMTIQDFRQLWLEEAADPPAYIDGIYKEERKQLESPKRLKRSREGSAFAQSANEHELAPISPNGRLLAIKSADSDGGQDLTENAKGKLRALTPDDFDANLELGIASEISKELESTDGQAISTELERVEQMRRQAAESAKLDDLDEEELDSFILNSQEVKEKERIWMEMNKDYLEAMAQKQRAQEGEDRPAKKARPNARKKKLQQQPDAPMASAADSTRQMVKKQPRFSKRLNYAVLDSLFETGESVIAKSQPRREQSEDLPGTPYPPTTPQRQIEYHEAEADEDPEDGAIVDVEIDYAALEADLAKDKKDEEARKGDDESEDEAIAEEEAFLGFEHDEDAVDIGLDDE